MLCMAVIPGRGKRDGTGATGWPLLRARVKPVNFTKAGAIANSLGVPLAHYIDELLEREELDDRGRPLWWAQPAKTDQEELPLKSA